MREGLFYITLLTPSTLLSFPPWVIFLHFFPTVFLLQVLHTRYHGL